MLIDGSSDLSEDFYLNSFTTNATTINSYNIYADTAYTFSYSFDDPFYNVESVLDKMDLKDIEQYIRRKKLKNLEKNGNQNL